MRALVMGVLNVTPDSFYDGGRYFDEAAAIERGLEMIDEGADIIDVGGESSRPGAEPVDLEEELRRTAPVVKALAGRVRVSIDTMKEEVAEEACRAGATLVNDVSNSLAQVAAEFDAGLVVMHMQGRPPTMQEHPEYEDVVREVFAVLAEAAATAHGEGIGEVYVDPGIGFGKTTEHNLALLGALPELVAAGEPVLVGTSRKSFLGRILNAGSPSPPGERFAGSLATAVWAMAAGASIVRVHDVRPTVDAARLVGDLAGLGSAAGVVR